MHKEYKSPLSKMMITKIDKDDIKKQGYLKNQILVIDLNDNRLNWNERSILEKIGDRFYKRQCH